MFRILFILSSILLTLPCKTFGFDLAEPVKDTVMSNSKGLNLSRGVIMTGNADKEFLNEIEKLFDKNDIKVSTKEKKKQAVINIEKVSRIRQAGENAFSIYVNSSRCQIRYTTPESASRCIALLELLLSKSKNNKSLPACQITDWDKENGFKIIDVSSSKIQEKEFNKIVTQASKDRIRTIYLRLNNEKSWNLSSSAIHLIHPEIEAQGMYSIDEVNKMIEKCKENYIELIPVIDLLCKNEFFEKKFGHTVFSVEGMRFVNAILAECCMRLDCSTICVGNKSNIPSAGKYYGQIVERIEFLGKKSATINK